MATHATDIFFSVVHSFTYYEFYLNSVFLYTYFTNTNVFLSTKR
ncbi:unnamed protein product [Tenebrio molitor]|nr:unnamed protein product [Tenebrio molitor]